MQLKHWLEKKLAEHFVDDMFRGQSTYAFKVNYSDFLEFVLRPMGILWNIFLKPDFCYIGGSVYTP